MSRKPIPIRKPAASSQVFPDPGVVIVGKKCTIRIFLRTDGLYAITEDRGANVGADRYLTRATSRTLENATEVGERLAR